MATKKVGMLGKVGDVVRVELVEMTDEEREAFIVEDLVDYAAQLERDEACPPKLAIDRAREELDGLLRRQHAAASELGHRRHTAVGSSDEVVGWLWVTPFDPSTPHIAFLYQITVKPAMRGHGFGAAMLTALERMLAADDITELRLNVNDGNLPAQRLYARAGYEPATQLVGKHQLRKRLGGSDVTA
jgi:ribosomal protein S18 acetylase RimI-like enzyme